MTRLYGAVSLGLSLSRIVDDGAPVLRGYSTYRVAYRLYTPPLVGAYPYYIMMDHWGGGSAGGGRYCGLCYLFSTESDSAKLRAYDVNC